MRPREERNAKNQLQGFIDSVVWKLKVSRCKLTNPSRVLGILESV